MQMQLPVLVFSPERASTRFMGWVVVALIHVVLGWFLLHSMRVGVSVLLPTPVKVSFIKAKNEAEVPYMPIPMTPLPTVAAIMAPMPEVKVVSRTTQAANEISPPQSEVVIVGVGDDAAPTVESSMQTSAALLVVSDSAVDYVQRPLVRYPLAAKRMKQEGLVLLSVVVDERGAVQQIAIFKSSGYPRLDDAALRAVRASLKVKPYVHNGTAISVEIRIPVEFSLSSAV